MATIDSTVIEGPVAPIRVLADNGREAKASIDYSNYDAGATVVNSDLTPGGEIGQAVLDETHTTEFEPGFVDAAAGDYHLASTSALIDAGDPAAPEAGELDLDGGARAISPLCPLAVRASRHRRRRVRADLRPAGRRRPGRLGGWRLGRWRYGRREHRVPSRYRDRRQAPRPHHGPGGQRSSSASARRPAPASAAASTASPTAPAASASC